MAIEKTIPYGRQNISDEDIQRVVEVLKSDYLTQGPMVPEFENQICSYAGSKYATAVNSGTSALHIACLALGLGKGDWLWTTPITFVASANCGLYCGAKIDFIDIDPETWNLSIEKLKLKLEAAENSNRLPKIVVAVHLCGYPCDMEIIHELSKQYGFHVIEDASHAVGGKYKGEPIGSCQFSDITVFSFHPVKTITTGEGGMAVTNDRELSTRMELFRSHGITRDPMLMTGKTHGPWYYQQIELGYNYRMTDLQAALGISQLRRIDEFIARRHYIAKRYDEELAGYPLQKPHRSSDKYSGMHLYVVRLKEKQANTTRHEMFDSLRKQGIGVNVHYIPVHTQPYYKKMGFTFGDFPEAEQYYSEAISLPMFPDLTDEDIETVVGAVRKSLK